MPGRCFRFAQPQPLHTAQRWIQRPRRRRRRAGHSQSQSQSHRIRRGRTTRNAERRDRGGGRRRRRKGRERGRWGRGDRLLLTLPLPSLEIAAARVLMSGGVVVTSALRFIGGVRGAGRRRRSRAAEESEWGQRRGPRLRPLPPRSALEAWHCVVALPLLRVRAACGGSTRRRQWTGAAAGAEDTRDIGDTRTASMGQCATPPREKRGSGGAASMAAWSAQTTASPPPDTRRTVPRLRFAAAAAGRMGAAAAVCVRCAECLPSPLCTASHIAVPTHCTVQYW